MPAEVRPLRLRSFSSRSHPRHAYKGTPTFSLRPAEKPANAEGHEPQGKLSRSLGRADVRPHHDGSRRVWRCRVAGERSVDAGGSARKRTAGGNAARADQYDAATTDAHAHARARAHGERVLQGAR